jgi:hypothetical protein
LKGKDKQGEGLGALGCHPIVGRFGGRSEFLSLMPTMAILELLVERLQSSCKPSNQCVRSGGYLHPTPQRCQHGISSSGMMYLAGEIRPMASPHYYVPIDFKARLSKLFRKLGFPIGLIRYVRHAIIVRWALDIPDNYCGYAGRANRPDKEAQFKDDVLPRPWLRLFTCFCPFVIWRHKNNRKADPLSFLTELCDQWASFVRAFVKNDGFKFHSFKEPRNGFARRPVMTMNHENSARRRSG